MERVERLVMKETSVDSLVLMKIKEKNVLKATSILHFIFIFIFIFKQNILFFIPFFSILPNKFKTMIKTLIYFFLSFIHTLKRGEE